jgi:GNAT superfamily N-acetyltransferase
VSIVIRPETPADTAAIAAVTREAFRHAAHSSQTEHLIVDALRSAGALTLSLVAVAEGEIVGHIAFSPVTIDRQPTRWLGLGPLSVAPPRQRQGIGSLLVRAGLDELRQQQSAGCLLPAIRLPPRGRPQTAGRARRILPGATAGRVTSWVTRGAARRPSPRHRRISPGVRSTAGRGVIMRYSDDARARRECHSRKSLSFHRNDSFSSTSAPKQSTALRGGAPWGNRTANGRINAYWLGSASVQFPQCRLDSFQCNHTC